MPLHRKKRPVRQAPGILILQRGGNTGILSGIFLKPHLYKIAYFPHKASAESTVILYGI